MLSYSGAGAQQTLSSAQQAMLVGEATAHNGTSANETASNLATLSAASKVKAEPTSALPTSLPAAVPGNRHEVAGGTTAPSSAVSGHLVMSGGQFLQATPSMYLAPHQAVINGTSGAGISPVMLSSQHIYIPQAVPSRAIILGPGGQPSSSVVMPIGNPSSAGMPVAGAYTPPPVRTSTASAQASVAPGAGPTKIPDELATRVSSYLRQARSKGMVGPGQCLFGTCSEQF